MTAPSRPTFPLSLAEEGATVRVIAIRGGSAFVLRVAELGINVGCELAVRQREGGGLVVARGAARFALGAGMAQRILVAAEGAADESSQRSKQS
ncbi:FeoA family protein [Pseudothauera rhizosphaerae]|uniref:Ferrous iron transport protein A n=1 Tax=Pseudothauera rhizosphaerae TaxID=2565932 RepID=A0A4S4ATL1_9RHOO|nr:FeoA family protein [Pseudothauera rhizosphaerae]THF63257.1 ferrous iron transport protein A [Pseudothauera rhizosphaerae]